MAEKKSSGFRFRLPWFPQPAPTPTPQPPSKSPRVTTQTSVASTSAQRPPFRPPGKAPAQAAPVAAPPMVATPAPAPASPKRSPPQSLAPPPSSPPSVSPKSSVPKSPIAKTIEPVATQAAKETKTTTETIPTIETKDPATPPRAPPFRPLREAQSQPSPPQTPPAEKPESEPSSPRTPPQSNSQPLSPSHMAAHLHEATPPRAASNPPSPFHLPPSQRHTPPRSPSPSASQPKHKPSPPSETTSEVAEIKRPIETSKEKFPVDTNHVPQVEDLALDADPREITKVKAVQAKSMDSNSMESKSLKPKTITPARIPLQREIKDDISKFIHKIATSSSKQSLDEKLASVITIAGDNTGASMHFGSDAIKRGYKLNTDSNAHDAAVNGNRSSQRDSKGSEDQETKAIVNSNIQGINNSMMLNSSVNERSPGVHLGFYRTLANINDSKMKNTEAMEMQRTEVSVTPPQKFIYDPANERSLEELFMEASESEADDAETSGKGYEIEVL